MEELDRIKAKQAKLQKEQAQLLQRIANLEKEVNKEQGKPPKTYTWFECFKKKGFYLEIDSKIYMAEGIASEISKNIATSEKVCKSHFAACQLSHIIERLNEDFGGDDNIIVICQKMSDGRCVFLAELKGTWALPYIKSSRVYHKLLETNLQLLNQYFGIDE